MAHAAQGISAPQGTVHRSFTPWREDRTWSRIHQGPTIEAREPEGREPSPSAAVIDSQSVETKQKRRRFGL